QHGHNEEKLETESSFPGQRDDGEQALHALKWRNLWPSGSLGSKPFYLGLPKRDASFSLAFSSSSALAGSSGLAASGAGSFDLVNESSLRSSTGATGLGAGTEAA